MHYNNKRKELYMIRVINLVNYILRNVDNDDIRYTQSVMNRKRCDLPRANWELYNDLENYVEMFIENNDLSDEWFETEVGLIEDLFDELLKEL